MSWSFCWLTCCTFAAATANAADTNEDQWDFERRQIARIPPGTTVDAKQPDGWNRVVLFATPRLAAGSISSIPRMARGYATRFNVVIMACVNSNQTSDVSPTYRLVRVGIGYCVNIGGKNIVISSASQDKLGAGLNTIEQIVLKKNEQVLDDVVQIAKSNTFTIFDVKAIVLAGNEHRDMLVRHLVWVYPETGKVASLVWPLVDNGRQQYQMADKFLYAIPEGFREDRIIHVSADEITFGIPSPRAFALARMPPGKKIAVTPEIVGLATRKKFNRESISKLVEAIRKAF